MSRFEEDDAVVMLPSAELPTADKNHTYRMPL